MKNHLMLYKIGKLNDENSNQFLGKTKKSVHPKTKYPERNLIFRCTQIKMYSWDNAQVVLVGNKSDLEQDRAVTQERGQRLADQLGNV